MHALEMVDEEKPEAAQRKLIVGELFPVEINGKNMSTTHIPLFDGLNSFGRNQLPVADRRISRKHLTMHASVQGSVEVHVEGTNPIVVRSEGQRKVIYCNEKVVISSGDVLELIPGNFAFKYNAVRCGPTSSGAEDSTSLKRAKIISEEENLVVKRSRQVCAVETSVQTLQKGSLVQGTSSTSQKIDNSHLTLHQNVRGSLERGGKHNSGIPKDGNPSTFRLLRVQGLPESDNSSSVTIRDVIRDDVIVAVLLNYMVDADWLISACPALQKVRHVLVVHGESGASYELLKQNKPANWVLHKPPLPISYGTHHSKAVFLVCQRGIRIVVHTANLIHVDWNNKSQGLWMQDFPWKENPKAPYKSCHFEDDLVDYLRALKLPHFKVNLPNIGDTVVDASFFRKFDYESATVRLVASVPGYHTGSSLKKWGHMKLRTILEEQTFDKEFCASPLVYQFSSLGSLDEKWMNEFASSMSAGHADDGSTLGMGKPSFIWPTVEDVRCSLEGYAAGNAIPSPEKNVEKDFLRKYWARWKADHVGRCRAMPHIKTYARYSDQNIAWFCLTSANLSKAAWGALQKNNTQLMIRSYELGVLFLPSVIPHGHRLPCTQETSTNQIGPRTKLVTLCWHGNTAADPSVSVVRLPIPYRLPPQKYQPEDAPWSWDRRYTKKDVHGQVWPPRQHL